jgi:DNA modification methylase
MHLHNEGKPFDCDMTFSKGNFYGQFKIKTINEESFDVEIPAPKYKFDVYPQIDGVEKIEPLGELPFENDSINSMVVDLPFVISCGPSLETPDYDENGNKVKNNIISRRFASYYPVAQLLESYTHWLKEAYRTLKPNGILIWKCQNTITGSKFLATPAYSRMIAESLGFDTLDEFILLAKNRLISGKINKQQHARSFHSYFLVFKKSLKKKISYFDFMEEEEINTIVNGLVNNNLSVKKKKRIYENQQFGNNKASH